MCNERVVIVDWREKAFHMFFKEHMKIVEISKKLNRTRKTISTFLSAHEGYEAEKERRKKVNQEKRKEYKSNWEKSNRKLIESACLKRQHNIDVAVLSAEKY